MGRPKIKVYNRFKWQQPWVICWRALARQLPILYNREKKAKSVGRKIEDIRSRLCFLYPGIPGCLLMHVEILIDFGQQFSSARNQGHDKWMSLIACGSIHEGHEWFSDDSRGRQESFVFGCSITVCEQFCRFAIEGANISIKSYFMRSFFFLCIQQQWSVSQNYFYSE